MVGSNSPAFSVSRKCLANSGGSSENFEQRVRGLLHEGRTGENVDAFASLSRTVVNCFDYLANLIDLDHQLRRIGRDDEDVGVGLNEEPGFFFVRVTQIFASLDGFGEACVKIFRLCYA